MAFNFFKQWLGVKAGQKAEDAFDTAGNTLLPIVAPGVLPALATLNTIKTQLGSTTTVSAVVASAVTLTEADLDKLLNGFLGVVNARLTAAGVPPMLEAELDNDLVSAFKILETEGAAALENALGVGQGGSQNDGQQVGGSPA